MVIWKSLYKLLIIKMTSSGIRWYFNTDSINLWRTSPKAFCRSINVMVTERCLRRASFIMCDMLVICSKVPLKPGVSLFCIEVSTYLFFCKTLNTLSLNKWYKNIQHNSFQCYRSKVWRVRFITLFINLDGSCSLSWFWYSFSSENLLTSFKEKGAKNGASLETYDRDIIKRTGWTRNVCSFDYFAYFVINRRRKVKFYRCTIEFRYPVWYSKQLSGINRS